MWDAPLQLTTITHRAEVTLHTTLCLHGMLAILTNLSLLSHSYNPYGSPYGSTFQSGSSESKAFVVKLLNNQIKKCRGCNGEFSRKVDGSLPDPPLNVVVCHEDGHLETHQMSRDSVGPKMCIIVQISRAFSCLIISIYRLTLSCLMLIRNTFVNTWV